MWKYDNLLASKRARDIGKEKVRKGGRESEKEGLVSHLLSLMSLSHFLLLCVALSLSISLAIFHSIPCYLSLDRSLSLSLCQSVTHTYTHKFRDRYLTTLKFCYNFVSYRGNGISSINTITRAMATPL